MSKAFRKHLRKDRSGLLPQTFSKLSQPEKDIVIAAHINFNKTNPKIKIDSVESYYQRVYKKGAWAASNTISDLYSLK